jgi:hypothetical protein
VSLDAITAKNSQYNPPNWGLDRIDQSSMSVGRQSKAALNREYAFDQTGKGTTAAKCLAFSRIVLAFVAPFSFSSSPTLSLTLYSLDLYALSLSLDMASPLYQSCKQESLSLSLILAFVAITLSLDKGATPTRRHPSCAATMP